MSGEKWVRLTAAEWFIGLSSLAMAASLSEDEMSKRLAELPVEWIGRVPAIKKSDMARVLASAHWNCDKLSA